jgi:hypothetical protein
MRRSVKVGIALGGAALLGAALSRHRSAPKGPPVQRTLLLVSAVVVAQWWNPTTWWGTVSSLGSAAIQDIENWARDAISKAFAIYDAGLQFVLGLTDSLINAALAGVDAVAHNLSGIAGQLYGVIVSTIPNAIQGLWDTALGWVHDAENAASWALGLVQGWATELFQYIESDVESLWTNYIAPAFDWVENAEGWLVSRLTGWADDMIAFIGGVISSAVGAVENDVQGLADLVDHEVLDAVHVVEKAWDWLVWLGEYPLHEVEAILSDPASLFPGGFIRQAGSDVGSYAQGIEGAWETMLGN